MTELELESYAVGTNVGESLKQTSQELNIPSLLDAIKDVLEGNEPKMTVQEVNQHLESFGKKMQENQAEIMKKLAESNLEIGEKFLEENRKKEGVTVTPSGLQYEILQEGDGPRPSAESVVKVHYSGKTIDGAEFDSSYKRGEPTQFPVNGVIKGWTEALQLMGTGSKWKLTIPAEIAYGPQGAGQAIGPNEVLCFEVELLEIVQ